MALLSETHTLRSVRIVSLLTMPLVGRPRVHPEGHVLPPLRHRRFLRMMRIRRSFVRGFRRELLRRRPWTLPVRQWLTLSLICLTNTSDVRVLRPSPGRRLGEAGRFLYGDRLCTSDLPNCKYSHLVTFL